MESDKAEEENKRNQVNWRDKKANKYKKNTNIERKKKWTGFIRNVKEIEGVLNERDMETKKNSRKKKKAWQRKKKRTKRENKILNE